MSRSLAVDYVKNVLMNALSCSSITHLRDLAPFNYGIEWIVLEKSIKNSECQNLPGLGVCTYSGLTVIQLRGRNMWARPQNIPVKSRVIIRNTQTTGLWGSKSTESLHHHAAPRTQALPASLCTPAELMLFSAVLQDEITLQNQPHCLWPPTLTPLSLSHFLPHTRTRSHLVHPASLTMRQLFLHNGIFHFNTSQEGLSPIGGKRYRAK